MQFSISDTLFDRSLVLGKNGLFLDANDRGFQLTNVRPRGSVTERIEAIFDNQSAELAVALGRRSPRDLKTFLRNVIYFTEKLNVDDRWGQSYHFLEETFMYGAMGVVAVSAIAKEILDLSGPQTLYSSIATVALGYFAFGKAKRCYQRVFTGKIVEEKCEALRTRLMEFVGRAIKGSSVARKKIQGVQFAGIDRIFTMHRSLIDKMASQERLLARMAYRNAITLMQKKKAEGMCVFLHGQGLAGAMLTKLFTCFIKSKEPERAVDQCQFMRLASSGRHRNTNDFFNNYYAVNDDYPEIADQLLAVSINPLEWSPLESAFSFWRINAAISSSVLDSAIWAIKKQTDRQDAAVLIRESFQQMEAIFSKKQNSVGNLAVICIPANQLENQETCIGYQSYAFGMYVPSFLRKERIAALASKDWVTSAPCQARLLAHQLVPENGVEIHNFNTLSKEDTDQCDAIIETLVKQLT